MDKDTVERIGLSIGDDAGIPSLSVCDGNGSGCGCASGCHGYEGCGSESWGLTDYPLGMVYAPCQTFRALYDPETGLSRGTLFSELDLPLGASDGGGFGTSCRMCRKG